MEEIEALFESSLSTLLEVTELSGNLKKSLKENIRNSVHSLRNVYSKLNKEIEGKCTIIKDLEAQLAQRDQQRQGGRRALFSEVVTINKSETQGRKETKPFKVMVKAKNNQTVEYMKTLIKTKVNPVELKVGVRSFKPLRNGQLLMEAQNKDEVDTICRTINEKCGNELEATATKLRNPKLIIFNVPEEICVENAKDAILKQNSELEIEENGITPKFIFQDRKKATNLVVEVNPQTRNKIIGRKLKIGWSMCNNADYTRITRCYRCNKYNHRAQECKGEETCPICAEKHSLKDCRASKEQYKCINCVNHNRYNKESQLDVNHSSIDKNCSCYLLALRRYQQSIEY